MLNKINNYYSSDTIPRKVSRYDAAILREELVWDDVRKISSRSSEVTSQVADDVRKSSSEVISQDAVEKHTDVVADLISSMFEEDAAVS